MSHTLRLPTVRASRIVLPVVIAGLTCVFPCALSAQKPSKADTTVYAAAVLDVASGLQGSQQPTPLIRIGETVQSTIDARDRKFEQGQNYEAWTVNVARGQWLFVTMRSRAFDARLHAVSGHNGDRSDNDNFESSSTDARYGLRAVVPTTYLVLATSSAEGMRGNYTLEVSTAGRAVGTNRGQARGTGGIPIAIGQSVREQLGISDPMLSDDSFYDEYTFAGVAGDRIVVTMRSPSFDTFLKVVDSSDREIASNDDFVAGSSDSQVTFTVPSTGRISIFANSFEPSATGNYTLTLERARP